MKVRIAVAINGDEEWSAAGYFSWKDEHASEIALEGLDTDAGVVERVVFVEVDIPTPTKEVVQGDVVI